MFSSSMFSHLFPINHGKFKHTLFLFHFFCQVDVDHLESVSLFLVPYDVLYLSLGCHGVILLDFSHQQ